MFSITVQYVTHGSQPIIQTLRNKLKTQHHKNMINISVQDVTHAPHETEIEGVKTGMRVGYDRIASQIGEFAFEITPALKAANCTHLVLEACEELFSNNKELQNWLELLDTGDVLVLRRLDRFVNSFRTLSQYFLKLMNKGVSIEVIHPPMIFDQSEAGLARFEVLAAYLDFLDVIKKHKQNTPKVPRFKNPNKDRSGPHNTLRFPQQEEIKQRLMAGKVNISALAREYGVARNTMYSCIRKIRSVMKGNENV